MKYSFKTLAVALFAAVAGGLSSCSNDDFTATIFDTDPAQDYLDKTQYTFPLDTFLKKEFLEPYNVKFVYKFEDKSSDMNKNLTPAAYDKSVDLAVLAKYLWYDVYTELGGSDFLKIYSPRIINVTGSKNYNASQGTEVLGDASSGVKINLYNVNNLDVTNLDMMNEYFFKTMHHEFSHILDQTVSHPTSFNVLSNGYDAAGWSDAADSLKAGQGFVTPYASSATSEDWAESMANYITMDTLQWKQKLESASFDWEEIDCSSQTEYNKLITPGCNLDTIGYFKSTQSGSDTKIYRRVCLRNADGTVVLDENGQPQWQHNSGIDGRAVILQKVDLVRKYLKENYGLDLDAMREIVQSRTLVRNSDGTYALDRFGRLINKLTETQASGQTLIDELRDQVYKFNSLVEK